MAPAAPPTEAPLFDSWGASVNQQQTDSSTRDLLKPAAFAAFDGVVKDGPMLHARRRAYPRFVALAALRTVPLTGLPCGALGRPA